MAPDGDLVRIRDYVAPAQARERVTDFIRATWGPRLDALGGEAEAAAGTGDAAAVERALFRTSLVRFLALEGRDPGTRTRLAIQAARFIGAAAPGAKSGANAQQRSGSDPPGAQMDLTAVPAALVEVALQVGVQEGGAPFVETLIERMLASNDIQFRSQAALALGASDDPAVAARVRELFLDPRLRVREPTTIAFAMAARPSQRRATFDWFKTHHEAFIGRISHFGYRWLPRFGAAFCTLPERDEVQAFFTPLLSRLDGAERTLAETLEGIELCVALAEVKRDEVARHFSF
jgi:hypothetical protein